MDNVYKICSNKDIYASVEKIYGIFQSLCFSVLIIILLIYCVRNFLAIYSGKDIENILKIILKSVCIYLIATNSIYVLEYILHIFQIISDFISQSLSQLINIPINFSSFITKLELTEIKKYDLFSVDGLINSLVCYGSVSLLINYSIKFVILIILIVLAPIAIMTMIISNNNIIIKKWIKLLFSLLLSPILVKVLIAIPLIFKEYDEIFYKIILIGVFNIFSKIDNYIKEIL